MQESNPLPALAEETEDDKAKLADFVTSEHFFILKKYLLNRVAERNQELFTNRDLTMADRMEELLSFLSELEDAGE